MNRLKDFCLSVTPPLLVKWLAARRGGSVWSGNYRTWEDACRDSTGYEANEILEKVRESLLLVKTGKAVYERDSVLFDKIHYSWPLLAALLWIASRNGNVLRLVDFGGSLGSSFFQNRHFIQHLSELRWNVVEQQEFVSCGKRYFEDEHLKFFLTIDASLAEPRPDTILFSSVIQYVEQPYELLEEVILKGFRFLLFDRTSFVIDGNDRLTVQKVSSAIYEASYPCWFFSKSRFMDLVSTRYHLIAEFASEDLSTIPSTFNGFIFERKEDA